MSAAVNVLVLVLILLIAESIGPEIDLRDQSKNLESTSKRFKHDRASKYQRPSPKKLDIHGQQKINQKDFLDIFVQESKRLDLSSCLNNAFGVSSGSLEMAAVLNLNGHLSQIRSVGQSHELPVCVINYVANMNFSQILPAKQPKVQTIYWRVDW